MMENAPSKEPQNEESQPPGTVRSRPTATTMIFLIVLFIVMAMMIYSMQEPNRSEITYDYFWSQLQKGNIAEVEIRGLKVSGRFNERPDKPKKPKDETAASQPDDGEVAAAEAGESEDAKASAIGDVSTDEKATVEKATGAGAETAGEESQDKKPEKYLEHFSTELPAFAGDTLHEELLKQNVIIKAQQPQDSTFLLVFVYLFVTVLLFVVVWVMFRRARDQFMGGGGLLSGFTKSPAQRYETDQQRITFDDVAGLAGVKMDLQEIIDFLKDPEKFQRLGGHVPKGVLLMGPPGTGKTLLARAVAGEAEVPFFSINGSEFIQMFVGVGAGRVRDMFKTAKEAAPAILFIDEIDAVGRHRGAGLGGGHDEREQTLNQILSEMDGFQPSESVIVLAATNRPDVLDPALLRPGRFDRHVTVDRPTQKGRVEIFGVHVRNIPLADDVNLEKLAAGTVGLTGADIRNLVNEATLWATREGKEKVDMEDFEHARDKVLMGAKREEVLSDKEKEMTAYHEAGHALLAWLVPGNDRLHKVTIIPRGRALGVTQLLPEEDRLNINESDLRARLIFMLGGRAAEKLIYDEYSAGAENDLSQATALARRMVAHWGMSERLGPVAYHVSEEQPFLGKEIHEQRQFSEHTAQMIDEEVAKLLHSSADRAQEILAKHRDKLVTVTEALVEREMLDEDEVSELIGPSINQRNAERNGQPEAASESEQAPVT